MLACLRRVSAGNNSQAKLEGRSAMRSGLSSEPTFSAPPRLRVSPPSLAAWRESGFYFSSQLSSAAWTRSTRSTRRLTKSLT